MRIPDAGLKIAGNSVIDIGGDDKALYTEAESLGDKAGGDVAEVAARNREDYRLSLLCGKRCYGLKIVADLGEQAADVDGVRGVEADSCPDLLVIESLLDERLAVIEGAAHSDGPDVAAEGAEQLLLQGADLALRIEHADIDVLEAEEGMCDSSAGVSGGRGQDGDLPVARNLLKAPCHEACAEVLERERGAVEQLKRAYLV